jgi:hypothetical protein
VWILKKKKICDFWCFNATFNNISAIIMATSFSGGGSRREPPTMGKQLVNFFTCDCESSAPFLAHLAKGHVSFCHHLASVVRRKLSHLNLLLRNHWANSNQTLVEWSLDGSLPKLCSVITTSYHVTAVKI